MAEKIEGLVEKLKSEDDWEHGDNPEGGCLYTMRKDDLRYVVYKIPYDNNCRLRTIGIKGKTQTFVGEPINNLYEALAEKFGCNEPEGISKSLDEIYKRALGRLTEKKPKS